MKNLSSPSKLKLSLRPQKFNLKNPLFLTRNNPLKRKRSNNPCLEIQIWSNALKAAAENSTEKLCKNMQKLVNWSS